MVSIAPSLHLHPSLSAIAQVLGGYNTAGVLLHSEVQHKAVFDPNEVHVWLGWVSRTQTLVVSCHVPHRTPYSQLMLLWGQALFDSYAQLLRSTGIPVLMFFSLREVSSIIAHLDFRLTCIYNTPRMLFFLKRLYLWRLAYKPLPEHMHEQSLLLHEIIEMFSHE